MPLVNMQNGFRNADLEKIYNQLGGGKPAVKIMDLGIISILPSHDYVDVAASLTGKIILGINAIDVNDVVFSIDQAPGYNQSIANDIDLLVRLGEIVSVAMFFDISSIRVSGDVYRLSFQKLSIRKVYAFYID